MKKIVHLIPYDGIGGVESAANTMKDLVFDDIDFNIFFIFDRKRKNFLNPYKFIHSAYELIKIKPDLLVVSLWRSCITAIIVKFFKPKTKIVLFLHYPHHYHFVDMFFTKLMSKLSLSIWADSQDTLDSRLPNYPKERSYIISFVARKLKPIENLISEPNFIFWGRLHEQKCIDRSIKIFSKIKANYENAKFIIIGPDGGMASTLKGIADELKIKDNIHFVGLKNLSSIIDLALKSSFYLQTSKLEGMAMSVVEAMQLGLLPVVTPVGEIKNYCEHNKNAIIIRDDADAVSCILALIKDKDMYLNLRNGAINKRKNYEIYSESFIRTSKLIMDFNFEK